MILKPPAFGEGQRIGLFGGSFNPAHYGHYMVALYALKRLELDWVWWLVSPQNPLKDPSETGEYAAQRKGDHGVLPGGNTQQVGGI